MSFNISFNILQDVGVYCPADNQTLRKGAFTVHTERGNGTQQYSVREMKISHTSKVRYASTFLSCNVFFTMVYI